MCEVIEVHSVWTKKGQLCVCVCVCVCVCERERETKKERERKREKKAAISYKIAKKFVA